MVDGINFNRPVGQSNGNSKDAPKIYKDSAPKVSIFTDNGQKPVANDSTTQGFQMFRDSAPKLSSANSEGPTIDGGTLPEVVVTPQKPKEDVATIDGGTLPEVEIVAQRPNKDVATIDGGTLPEVEIVGKKPNKALANNTVPQDTQTAAPKHKKGFFAWFGKTFGFSKS